MVFIPAKKLFNTMWFYPHVFNNGGRKITWCLNSAVNHIFQQVETVFRVPLFRKHKQNLTLIVAQTLTPCQRLEQ